MKKLLNLSRLISIILCFILIYSCKKDKPPTLTTSDVKEISQTTASSGGVVTADGGASIVSRGICWNTSDSPTISNSKTIETGTLGSFTSSLSQLTPNTLYYVRAYAMNTAGIGYGNQVTFTTSQISLATLTTTPITSITQSSAISGGDITADNGGSVTARGVCWSTTRNPTTANNKTTDGTGLGSFVSNLTGLQPGTIYYIRAYATNSAGTAYGNEIYFETQPYLSNSLIVFDNYNNIYSCNLDGTNIKQLTSGTSIDFNPRINYLKTKIAFFSNRTGRYEIFSMNIDGTGLVQLTTTGVSGGQSTGGIDWTPDGKLLFINDNKIYKMNADGSGIVEVATAPSNEWAELRCSPNGDKIIAQTQGSWGYTLTMYIMNIDGTNMSEFAPDLAGVQIIGSFTKDGLSFLYSYDLSGHEESSGQSWDAQIISKKLDGSGTTNLSTSKPNGTNDFRPVYSTDGDKILFINNVISAGTTKLWIMNADGTNRQQLITNLNATTVDCK